MQTHVRNTKRELSYGIASGVASLMLLCHLFSSPYTGRYPEILIFNLKADFPFVIVALVGLIAGLRLVSHGWKIGFVPALLSALQLILYIYSFLDLMIFTWQA